MTYHNQISRRRVLAGLGVIGLLAACQPKIQKFDAQTIILGAGLSGLYAAHLLAEQGQDVIVLEAADRIGGRMQTIYHNGHYTEGGGEQIGASYARILDRANALGVALSPGKAGRRQTVYHYNNRLFGPEEWKTFDGHPLKAPFKGASPGAALFGLAGRDNPLSSAGDWRSAAHKAKDISAEAFLQSKGMTPQALAYVDQTLNANALSSYSMMNLYRSLFLYRQSSNMGPSVYVEGGVQKLMDAMGQGLNIKTNTKIKAITVEPDGVMIEADNGKTFRAENCICALPFGALRKVKINASLGTAQREAITDLPYTQIMQLHFETEKEYWKDDGLPADMWTDGPFERVFANQNLNGDMTGLCRIWINGTGADTLAGKSDRDLMSQAQNWIDKNRPSMGKINVYKIQRWNRENSLAGGAYMHWAPGQIIPWAETMGEPAGRLHFCGEHLSHLHTGMEGALESAENAAFRLLDV